MSTTPDEHKAMSPTSVRCAVVTVSDTRTEQTDVGGRTIVDMLQKAGHEVLVREIIRDEPNQMLQLLVAWRDGQTVDAVLMTGGTGVSQRDQTFETVTRLIDKPLPGYGELLRMLSYQQIGPAAMLSRAVGGLMGRTVVLTMPGSRAAVKLAMEEIILPELGHVVGQALR